MARLFEVELKLGRDADGRNVVNRFRDLREVPRSEVGDEFAALAERGYPVEGAARAFFTPWVADVASGRIADGIYRIGT